MLFLSYWMLAALVLVLTANELFTTKDWRKQLSAAIVLVPLIMRIFLFK